MIEGKIETVVIRTSERVAEISWFNDIIGGDTAYLGVLDNDRRSSYEHCREITLEAEKLGFSNILYPSAYTVGQDGLAFAAIIKMPKTELLMTKQIKVSMFIFN